MNTILAEINNRDKAIFFWLTIFAIYAVVVGIKSRNLQTQLIGILKRIFFSQLTPYFIAVVVYPCLLVFVLYKVHFWDIGMVKDTVYWFLGSALALAMGTNDAQVNGHFFKEAVVRNFRFTILIEFILNFYVLSSVFFEIPLVFAVAMIPLLIEVANTNANNELAKKYLQVLYSIIGTVILIYVFINLIINFRSIATFENAKIFLLPIILTILFIPLVYIASLYGAYDEIFARLQHDKPLAIFTIWQVVKVSRLRLSRVNVFSRNFILQTRIAKNRADIMEIITDYKSDLHSLKRAK